MRVVGVKSAGYRLLLVVVMNVLSGALQAQHPFVVSWRDFASGSS